MDVGLFERLMDEVGPYLLTISLWAWGEPLLHPHLEEILRTVRKHDMVILLSTNGQCLDSDRVLEVLANEPPTHLIVAIDGLTDETNSKYRVGARLSPILAGVRRLAEIKRQRGLELPVLQMRYIVMKHNQHEVPQLEDFAQRNGFEFLTVRTLSIIDSDAPDQVHGRFMPDAAAWRAYEYQNGARVQRSDFICQEPFWFPTVFADGTLVACEQDFNAQQALGVISKDVSFADVWFSQRAAQVRKIIRDDPQSLSFCRNCPYCDRPTTDVSVQAHFVSPDTHYPPSSMTRDRT
jgi:radical SAM protein with 4Fe4S-binding SPASM domain